MVFLSPTLTGFTLDEIDLSAVISLSMLEDDLILEVPDQKGIAPSWDVYPILGMDPDEPDWTGTEEPAGYWNDRIDDAVKLTGIELKVPKAVLEDYRNMEIELRYKFADESSLEPYSAPVLLHIRP